MYKFRNDGPGVIRLSDGAVITPDPIGRHWREYLDWMFAGNEALPADPPQQLNRWLPKAVIVDRLTDEELELFKSVKPSLPARLIFLWDEATNNVVNPNDERLVAAFTTIIGATRTSEVLQSE